MSEELAQALLIGYVTYRSAEAIASAFSFTPPPLGSRAIARLFSFTNPLYSAALAPRRAHSENFPFAFANSVTESQSHPTIST